MSDRFLIIKNKYIATFAEKQKDLQTAWDNKDVAQLHDLMHKIAGSSGAYGFQELSDQVRNSMEAIADDSDVNSDRVKKSVLQIISTLKKIRIQNKV